MSGEEYEAISNLVGKSRKVMRDRNFAPTREEVMGAGFCPEDCSRCDMADRCESYEEDPEDEAEDDPEEEAGQTASV